MSYLSDFGKFLLYFSMGMFFTFIVISTGFLSSNWDSLYPSIANLESEQYIITFLMCALGGCMTFLFAVWTDKFD